MSTSPVIQPRAIDPLVELAALLKKCSLIPLVLFSGSSDAYSVEDVYRSGVSLMFDFKEADIPFYEWGEIDWDESICCPETQAEIGRLISLVVAD